MSAINNLTNNLTNLSINKDSTEIIESINNPPKGWEEVFKESQKELKIIRDKVSQYEKENVVYPKREDVFNAFRLTPLKDIKILILGSVPYANESKSQHTAMGLAFSVHKGVKIPPSLVNIYKELSREYTDFKTPSSGDLTPWAQQGVFLLNMSLTVNAGSSGSHGNLWMLFIKKVINAIVKSNPNVIFVLWGKPAGTIIKYIPKDVNVLTSSHPSPLSATKTATPFIGNGHFTIINDMLIKMGKTPINWQL